MKKILLICFLITPIISLIAGQCMKVDESGVDSNNQNIIVNKHNSLRLLLARGNVTGQPMACNMKRLQYDKQLANEAQKIANTCKFAHVKVQDNRWSWIGQNLYMSMSTAFIKGSNWNSAIQSWFNENTVYHYPDAPSSSTGHYTQVAWADTQFVGCGYTSYETNERFKYKKLYVCNYGPGGNIKGIVPYETRRNGRCGCQNLC